MSLKSFISDWIRELYLSTHVLKSSCALYGFDSYPSDGIYRNTHRSFDNIYVTIVLYTLMLLDKSIDEIYDDNDTIYLGLPNESTIFVDYAVSIA